MSYLCEVCGNHHDTTACPNFTSIPIATDRNPKYLGMNYGDQMIVEKLDRILELLEEKKPERTGDSSVFWEC